MKSLLTALFCVVFVIAPLSAEELTGTLEQIQTSGKIKIGYRKSHPPLSFLGKDGKPAGYSIDICSNIVTEVGQKLDRDIGVEYIPVNAEERFKALADNKIDILCGATTKTIFRMEQVDFTELIFVTGASFMSLKTNDILGGNFTGKKIGVLKGTTTVDEVKSLFSDTKITADIVMINSTAEGIDALAKEKIDALAADQVVLIGLALDSEAPSIFSIAPNSFSYEPFALAVRRNDADFRLIADRVITRLNKSKQIIKIYDKWFGHFSNGRPAAFESLILLNSIPE